MVTEVQDLVVMPLLPSPWRTVPEARVQESQTWFQADEQGFISPMMSCVTLVAEVVLLVSAASSAMHFPGCTGNIGSRPI